MKTTHNLLITICALTIMFVISCKKDEPEIPGKYERGVLISNEGPFMDGTGTVSFYDPANKSIENRIFQTVNNRPPGNIVQSIAVFNNRAYIVVNNAAKIEVAEAGTFESIGVIEGLTSPRYFLGISSSKAYVSDWGGEVAIIDLNTLTKTGTIAAGLSPDRMLLDGNRAWVVNSAGWASDSTVTVIDTQTDSPLQTIVVGDNPSGIVKDANGKIWVICGGIFDWSDPANNTSGSVVRIHPDTFTIEARAELDDTYFDARLAINTAKNKLYFTFTGGLFTIDANAKSGLKSDKILSRPYYALGIDPATDEIYTSDPLDYAQPGYIFRFDPASNIVIDSVKAGIIPGNFLFLN
jgi:YVTN family beta-propeller protein